MKNWLLAAVSAAALLPGTTFAHRLDEYLQATILSIESNRVDGIVRLVPGIAVAPAVIESIGSTATGAVPAAEQVQYAQRILKDLTLKTDDKPLSLSLGSVRFSSIDSMREGLGEIEVSFSADLPIGGAGRKLVFENNHQQGMSVYLVNVTVPRDKNIHIARQLRNDNQSWYELDFAPRADTGSNATLDNSGGFSSAFRRGVHHIADGTDHLMFLLALLLPAPLLATSGQWRPGARLHQSLMKTVRIVTAFTIGHSLTLILSAFGIVHLASQPVEMLIAVSILVSAAHALRPVFPGRETAVAAFFGLIHGLAFASALGDLGLSGPYLLVSTLGFNAGIEAMQLSVVVVVLPSLLLLSVTSVYPAVRCVGASFIGIAALGWLMKRSFDLPNPAEPALAILTRHASALAGAFFLFSVVEWTRRRRTLGQHRGIAQTDDAHLAKAGFRQREHSGARRRIV